MFGLLKLLAYGLLGYAIYEFVRGVSGGTGMGDAKGSGGAQRRGDLRGDTGRAKMAGPVQGSTVETQDADGASTRHRVGRGAVAR